MAADGTLSARYWSAGRAAHSTAGTGPAWLRYLRDADHHDHEALVAVDRAGGHRLFGEDRLGDLDGGHCFGPTRVESQVDDRLLELGLRQAVLLGQTQVVG